jgi:hydroxyethylthiazole kinase-like uncharacterized protein yjeF
MAIKITEIKKRVPKRKKESHKHDNGQVLIVGGSIDYHGAPLLAALGALRSGVDLVYLAVPECNFEVTRAFSPSIIVHKFPGEFLSSRGRELIMSMALEVDTVVFGPGLGDRPETRKTLKELVEKIGKPTVLDANAIQVLEDIEKMPLPQKLVITPHHGEFEKLTGKPFKIRDPHDHKGRLIRALATDLRMNILLKGPVDIIASDDGKLEENNTGNPGMTVGGSGDVIAGLTAGLMAQGIKPFDACCAAAFVLGKAGDRLLKTKGFGYDAEDLANEVPFVLKELLE